MNRFQRVRSFFTGVFMILASLLLVLASDDNYRLITVVLAAVLIIKGINALLYYISMARFAVGGKAALFYSIFLLDFGAFTLTIADETELTIFLYLTGWHAFSGLVSILRALEAKRYKASWKMNMIHGIGSLLIAVLCVLSLHNINVLVYVYCGGLIYSGCIRIATAFRRTEIVFIQ